MLGFVNGLAIVIFLAQFGSFKTINPAGSMAFLARAGAVDHARRWSR